MTTLKPVRNYKFCVAWYRPICWAHTKTNNMQCTPKSTKVPVFFFNQYAYFRGEVEWCQNSANTIMNRRWQVKFLNVWSLHNFVFHSIVMLCSLGKYVTFSPEEQNKSLRTVTDFYTHILCCHYPQHKLTRAKPQLQILTYTKRAALTGPHEQQIRPKPSASCLRTGAAVNWHFLLSYVTN